MDLCTAVNTNNDDVLFFKVISLLEICCFERKFMSRVEIKNMICLRELVRPIFLTIFLTLVSDNDKPEIKCCSNHG